MKSFSLTIPEPCHQNWEAMTPEAQGRFCSSCQKTVVDFSGMNDQQLAVFFKQPQGAICGRFHADQLGRTISLPKKRIPWLRYFFTITLPAFLLSVKAHAQGGVVATEQTESKRPRLMGDTIALKGVEPVQPPIRRMLGRVRVTAKPQENPLQANKASAIGFDALPVRMRVGKRNKGFVEATLPVQPVRVEKCIPSVAPASNVMANEGEMLSCRVGGVMIIHSASTKEQTTVSPLPAKSEGNVSHFTVFPNPLPSGASISVTGKNLTGGTYLLEVFSSSGEVLQAREILLIEKPNTASLQLGVLAAGPYFLRLTQKGTGRRFTETVVVK